MAVWPGGYGLSAMKKAVAGEMASWPGWRKLAWREKLAKVKAG